MLEVHLNEPVVGKDIEMNLLLEVYLNEPVVGRDIEMNLLLEVYRIVGP